MKQSPARCNSSRLVCDLLLCSLVLVCIIMSTTIPLCKSLHLLDSHTIPSSVYETARCPSVCLSRSPVAAACGGFAAVSPAGRIYRLLAARPAPQQHGAAARRAAADAGSATLAADVGG